MTAAETPSPAAAIEAVKPWWARAGIVFWLCVGWIVAITLGAVFADFLPIRDPIDQDLDQVFAPLFSDSAILGTDANGRDLLARVIHGARVSLQLAYIAPLISMVVGLTLGICAGYFKGHLDSAISIFVDSILAFPNIVAITAILFIIGVTVPNMIILLAFFGLPADIRVARANTLLLVEREFITAARAQGAGNLRIMVRELLPNVFIPVISLVVFHMGIVIVIEGALSFLGVGFQPPIPTWGKMIADGFEVIDRAPAVAFVPSAAMFLTIVSLNLISDRLRGLTEVRQSVM